MKKSNPESTPFIAFYLRRPSCIYTASQLSAPPETAKGGAHMDSAFLNFLYNSYNNKNKPNVLRITKKFELLFPNGWVAGYVRYGIAIVRRRRNRVTNE